MYYDSDNECITDYIEFKPTAIKECIEELLEVDISDEVWSEMCEHMDFYDYFQWDLSSAWGYEMDIELISNETKSDAIDWIKATEEEFEEAVA